MFFGKTNDDSVDFAISEAKQRVCDRIAENWDEELTSDLEDMNNILDLEEKIENRRKPKIDWNAIIQSGIAAATTLGSILLICAFEREDSITSKAFSLIPKRRP